jgi:acyl carrier protein
MTPALLAGPPRRSAPTKENSMPDITSRVINVVAEQLSVEAAEIRPESSFQDDLGADSLDLVELIMAMEEEFDIKIDDEAAQKLKTVQLAVDFINNSLASK